MWRRSYAARVEPITANKTLFVFIGVVIIRRGYRPRLTRPSDIYNVRVVVRADISPPIDPRNRQRRRGTRLFNVIYASAVYAEVAVFVAR